MSKANSGWARKQTAVLLSATLALSPVMAVPALAGETDGDAAPQEQTVENGDLVREFFAVLSVWMKGVKK